MNCTYLISCTPVWLLLILVRLTVCAQSCGGLMNWKLSSTIYSSLDIKKNQTFNLTQKVFENGFKLKVLPCSLSVLAFDTINIPFPGSLQRLFESYTSKCLFLLLFFFCLCLQNFMRHVDTLSVLTLYSPRSESCQIAITGNKGRFLVTV